MPRPRPFTVSWTAAPAHSSSSDADHQEQNGRDSEEILLSRRVCAALELSLRRLHRSSSGSGSGSGEGEAGQLEVQDRRRIGVVLEACSGAGERRSLSRGGVGRSRGGTGGKGSKGLERLVCWARVDESASDEELTALIPRSLLLAHPHIFSAHLSGPQTVLLRPAHPLPLGSVFLCALSGSAYALARSDPDGVLQRLARTGTLVRPGWEVGFALDGEEANGKSNGHSAPHEHPPSDGSDRPFRYAYLSLLLEPVQQGILTCDTSLYVLPPTQGADEQELEEDEDETPTQSVYRSRSASAGSSGSWRARNFGNGFADGVDGVDGVESGGGEEGEEEGPEIDSSFLAHSLPPLPGVPAAHSQSQEPPSLAASISSLASLTHKPAQAEFLPLPSAWDPRGAGEGENGGIGERVLVRPADLARCGIFSGDWVLLRSPLDGHSSLARAFAEDDVPHSHSCSSGPALLAPPTLLHQFRRSHPLSPPAPLTLSPTPFQAHPPPLPTALTLTLARVASPASTSKRFQPLFLRALRRVFEGGKRLVREGMIIAVAVRSEERALVREGEDGEVDDELLDYDFPSSSSPPDTPIYFKVTNITYDTPSSALSSAAAPLPSADTYTLATLGELGCWFDPSKTRMVQSGVEHSLVPNLLLPGTKPALSPDAATPYGKLLHLAAACLSPSALEYSLQLTVLLRGQRGIGKYTTASCVARQLGMHVLEVNCWELVGESDAKTEGTLRASFEGAEACSPCVLVLRNLEALARNSQVLEQGKEPSIATALRDCISDLQTAWRTSQYPVILIATSAEADKIPLSVQACFKHDIAFEVPAEAERLEILEALLEDDVVAPDVSLKEVAAQSAALVAKDLVDLVGKARLGALERATKELQDADASPDDIEDAGLALTGADFTAALAESRASYSESIGAPKIPNVSWDDVGGLAEVKADILDTIQLPLEHPELFAEGLKKRSGILLYGPPGTGKTLLAKAVATSCSLNFFSVKGPELLNMYIGESEANVRRVFQRARDARPCVIFFDELDSVAPKRGNHGDSGGVMDRIVSQLLAELDGMSDGSSSAEVFVIGATNRPDLLDPALLRPGRFDRMLYLGVSTTHEAQLRILQALTRKFRLDPTLDLMRVAEQCPFNFTGADFYALCSDSMLKAMTRKAEEVDVKIAEWNSKEPVYGHPYPMTPQYYLAELASPEDTDFLVSQRDFEAALAELVPSVTSSEMEHYAAVQKKFSRDTINSEANLDRKGKGKAKAVDPPQYENVGKPASTDRKGKGKAKAFDSPGDDHFGSHARLADEI